MRHRFPIVAGIAAGASAALYLYAHRIERSGVSLERFTCPIDRPGIPPGGVTILHLSDFHFRAVDPVQEARLGRLRALLAREKYDIVAFTGDLIHDTAGLPRALAFLEELCPRVGAFCVPGNRDYWESGFKALLGTPEERAGLDPREYPRLIATKTRRMIRSFAGNERGVLRVAQNDVGAMLAALAERGIEPLVNRAVHLSGAGMDLWLAGIDDLNQGRPDLAAALEGVAPGAPLVLLAHNPDVWLDSRTRRADLILCGHTHGGQLRFPLLGAWYRQGTHLPRHKSAGWFEAEGSRMYVTRGLGESFPFRFGAPPQAALIRLASSRQGEAQLAPPALRQATPKQ